MQVKFDSQSNEKKLYEAQEVLRCQNEALTISLQELSNRTNVDISSTKNEYEKKTKEIANVMRSQVIFLNYIFQVKNHEENITIIKEQYKQIQKIYSTRVSELEAKLKTLTDKYKNLEAKRNGEIQGYINEINLIRKRMRSYEEWIYKLKKLTQGGSDKDYEEINNGIYKSYFRFIELNYNHPNFASGTQNFKSDMDQLEKKLNEDLGEQEMDMSGKSGSNIMEDL